MSRKDIPKGLSRHHCIPSSRSRCNTDVSIVLLPLDFHRCLHRLFENMLPEEIHEFLDIILEWGGVWTRKELHELIQNIKAETDKVSEDEEVN